MRDISQQDYRDNEYENLEVTPQSLAKTAHDCPACILAAIRQHKDDSIRPEFSYDEAKKALWKKVNAANT